MTGTVDRATARPLRVLHLLLWITAGGGGIQSYLRGLLQAFRDAPGVRLLGAAVNPGPPDAGFDEPPYVGPTDAGRIRRALQFGRHVRRAARGADLVQINGIYGPHFLLGAPCCWMLGVPYVVNPLNALAPWMLEQKALKKRLFFGTVGGFFLRKAACLLATSEPEAEFLARRFPRARTRLVRVGLAVPTEPRVRLLTEPPAPQLRLLYLGSFDPWKRVPLLVRAVDELRAAGIDARAVIGGEGPATLMQPVREEIARRGVGQFVTMAGYVTGERKLELLRDAHALVLPSVTDSYSLASAEALAQGLPVVLTEGSGAAPEIRRHDCGSVVPIEEGAAFVAALREYADPAVRRRRALNAHRYAREVLDLPRLREGMTALYREMAASKPQS